MNWVQHYWAGLTAVVLFSVWVVPDAVLASSEIVYSNTALSCKATIEPDKATGPPIRLTFLKRVGGGIELESSASGGTIEIVAQDFRAKFEALYAASQRDLQSREVWSVMNAGGTFHLTQRTKGGDIRSSRFEGVSPVAVFVRVEKACEAPEREHRRRLAEQKLTMSELQIRLVNWILKREVVPHVDPDAASAILNDEARERIRLFMMKETGIGTRYLDSAAYERILERGGFRIEPTFQAAGTFNGGVAAAKLGDLWGMIGKEGNWIITPRFEDAMGAEAGFMPIEISGRWGIVNARGRLIHKAKYDEIVSCRYERCPYQQSGRWGFLNVRGGTAAQPLYARVNKFRDGYAAVQRNQLWYLIDRSGEEFGPYDVKRLYSPSEGLMLFVDHKNRRGFLSLDGRVVVAARHKWARPFSGGLAAVWKSGKWGVINRSGRVVVPFRFENIGQFKDGLAPAQKEKAGSWGYVDGAGRFAVGPRYSRGFNFRDGIAIVRVPHPRKSNVTEPEELLRGYIDTQGRWVYRPAFEDVYAFSEGLAPVKIFGRWGYLDLSLIRRGREDR